MGHLEGRKTAVRAVDANAPVLEMVPDHVGL
jgi:hypothetical protein